MTLAEAEKVRELVARGLGPTAVQRAMKWKSLNRAVRAIARVHALPDVEWGLVSVNRRRILVPDDPSRRPTIAELDAHLEAMAKGEALHSPTFTRWVVKLAKASGLEAKVEELYRRSERVREYAAWTPEKAELLREFKAERRAARGGGRGAPPVVYQRGGLM